MKIWQLFWCVSGSGEFIIDNRRYILRQGQAALLLPGTGHSYHAIEDIWKVHFIGFKGKICKSIMDAVRLNNQGIYYLTDSLIFDDYVRRMEAIMAKRIPDKQLRCSKELYSLLLDLGSGSKRIMTSEFINDNNSCAHEIAMYLENNYMNEISLNDLKSAIGFSKEYLCTAFKKASGETIMQHLTKIRISRAKILLLARPDMSSQEVGESCGFKDASYFGKLFHKHVGMPPNAYRISSR